MSEELGLAPESGWSDEWQSLGWGHTRIHLHLQSPSEGPRQWWIENDNRVVSAMTEEEANSLWRWLGERVRKVEKCLAEGCPCPSDCGRRGVG